MSQAVAKKKDIGLKVASIYTELTAFPESGTRSYQLHNSDVLPTVTEQSVVNNVRRWRGGDAGKEQHAREHQCGCSLSTLHDLRASYRLHPSHVDKTFFDISMATVLYSPSRRRHDTVCEDTYSLHPNS
jgi:hypothetical protein